MFNKTFIILILPFKNYNLISQLLTKVKNKKRFDTSLVSVRSLLYIYIMLKNISLDLTNQTFFIIDANIFYHH